MEAMTEMVNIHDAKTQLSRLLQRVEAGERVVIARAGRPISLRWHVRAASKSCR